MGAFKNVKKYGYSKFLFRSLKNEISSRSPKMIDSEKKIREIYKNLIKNFCIKYV